MLELVERRPDRRCALDEMVVALCDSSNCFTFYGTERLHAICC